MADLVRSDRSLVFFFKGLPLPLLTIRCSLADLTFGRNGCLKKSATVLSPEILRRKSRESMNSISSTPATL